jgi:tetratricopeptide (TPR) repeat protein
MRISVTVLLAILVSGMAVLTASQAQQPGVTAQQPGVMSDAEINKEAATADSLYSSQNMVGALPLYEDLHKRQPESNAWRERLAMCLLGANGTDAERAANVARAHQLMLDAKASGDNSDLLQTVLEKLEAPVSSVPAAPPSPGLAAFRQAEAAFSAGDLPTALKFYQEAAVADPKLYEAPLYAGDTEFKQGNCSEADKWYAQAAKIDPNRETAFRYWGDCLMKQNDDTQAEAKYIEAIIADPYSRTPRLALKRWADATKALLAAPPITLPARPTIDAKGNVNVTVDPSLKDTASMGASMIYSMNVANWHSKKFKETYPNEMQYRHSLAEESDGIRLALTVLKEQKVTHEKMDASWRVLSAIDADGMLECWILLDDADQGIAQDYVAFRAAHRDLLHAYIAKYDVHPN